MSADRLPRYELAAYPGNITAGETTGILDLSEQAVVGLPDHDFWLFDEQDVYRMHYTPEGAFTVPFTDHREGPTDRRLDRESPAGRCATHPDSR
ncbi:DUF6879 family protein [Streptomyces sp. Ncost-T6T-1]|uniref:DUF6879 family protein n=1 Tax=Streptomyces sp. Ncost-T6T-1 TaxID=1100828 RepID=UPI00315B0A8B